jgi:hypothetical protein
MSLRQHKKESLREKIIQTSIDMFFDKGFDQTTVEDIACKLEISKRTFFRYFPAKEDVVLSLYDNLVPNTYVNNEKDLNADNPISAIKIVFYNFANIYDSKKKYFLNIEKLINDTPSINVRKIEKILQYTSQIFNLFHIKYNQKTLSNYNFIIHFSMSVFMSSICTWVESNGKIDLKKTMDEGFDLIDKKIYSI